MKAFDAERIEVYIYLKKLQRFPMAVEMKKGSVIILLT